MRIWGITAAAMLASALGMAVNVAAADEYDEDGKGFIKCVKEYGELKCKECKFILEPHDPAVTYKDIYVTEDRYKKIFACKFKDVKLPPGRDLYGFPCKVVIIIPKPKPYSDEVKVATTYDTSWYVDNDKGYKTGKLVCKFPKDY